MRRREATRLNAQIYGEATEWLVRSQTVDFGESECRAFDQWLRKSPEHQTAYMEIAAIWGQGSALDSNRKWDENALVRQAAQDPANLIPLPGAAIARLSATPAPPALEDRRDGATVQEHPPLHTAPLLPRTAPRSSRRWRLAAALVILAMSAGIGLWFGLLASPTYATGLGEQRSIQLDDGSTLELNTRSKVAVHFCAHERDITLVAGQALFHVAKDPLRPFVVTSGSTHVRAVGTEFDVYQKDSDTIVTVVEGRVAVLPGIAHDSGHTPHQDSTNGSAGASPDTVKHFVRQDSIASLASTYDGSPTPLSGVPGLLPPGESGAILLSAGEQLTVTSNSVRRTVHPIVTRATAWAEHQIIFEFASLSDVVAEFNRYNRRPLVIASSGLDTFHLSGVFSSTDPASLIQFLHDRLGLEIVETRSEIRIKKNSSYKR